jgi:hypothetical protein
MTDLRHSPPPQPLKDCAILVAPFLVIAAIAPVITRAVDFLFSLFG